MRKLIISIISILTMSMVIFTGCSTDQEEETTKKEVAEIKKGDVVVGVTADGNLEMPHHVKLRFGTFGTVKTIYVDEGDIVKAGTLLAKLDDTTQKIAITSAEYDIELALNELAEKVYPAIIGFPHYYPSSSALMRVEQAIEGLGEARKLLGQKRYKEAASKLRVAQHDLQASYDTLQAPITDVKTYPDIAGAIKSSENIPDKIYDGESYPQIPEALKRISQEQAKLIDIQSLIEKR